MPLRVCSSAVAFQHPNVPSNIGSLLPSLLDCLSKTDPALLTCYPAVGSPGRFIAVARDLSSHFVSSNQEPEVIVAFLLFVSTMHRRRHGFEDSYLFPQTEKCCKKHSIATTKIQPPNCVCLKLFIRNENRDLSSVVILRIASGYFADDGTGNLADWKLECDGVPNRRRLNHDG